MQACGWLVGKVFDSGLAEAFLPPSELGRRGSRDLRMAFAMSRSGDLGGARSAGVPVFSRAPPWVGGVSLAVRGNSKGLTGFSTQPPLPLSVLLWAHCAPASRLILSGMGWFQSSSFVFCSGMRTNFFKPSFFPSSSSDLSSSPLLGPVFFSPGSSPALGDSSWSGKHLSFPPVG